jgi:hypothetical protein
MEKSFFGSFFSKKELLAFLPALLGMQKPPQHSKDSPFPAKDTAA